MAMVEEEAVDGEGEDERSTEVITDVFMEVTHKLIHCLEHKHRDIDTSLLEGVIH